MSDQARQQAWDAYYAQQAAHAQQAQPGVYGAPAGASASSSGVDVAPGAAAGESTAPPGA
jgi:hypothetical protein